MNLRIFKLTALGLLLMVAMFWPSLWKEWQREVAILESTARDVQEQAADVLGASNSADVYLVSRVVDGDTLKVIIADKEETVRIVGINTPETVDPRRSVECFGKEASIRAQELLSGQRVRLERDSTQSDRDRYQRLLRFVFLADGTDVGLQLIQEGMAMESLYSSTPHQYHQLYVTAEEAARSNNVGLWASDACLK